MRMSQAVRLERGIGDGFAPDMKMALSYARLPGRYQFLREQVATLLAPSDALCVLALMAVGYGNDKPQT